MLDELRYLYEGKNGETISNEELIKQFPGWYANEDITKTISHEDFHGSTKLTGKDQSGAEIWSYVIQTDLLLLSKNQDPRELAPGILKAAGLE